MVGCKKKCGGISIEIYATSLSKKISTPSFAKEDIWLEARQSQSKLHSKHSDLKYLHVNLKYFWRAPKAQIVIIVKKSWFRAFLGQWYLFLLSNQSLLRKIQSLQLKKYKESPCLKKQVMSPLHKLIVRQIYQSCVTDFTLQGVLPGFLTSATWARQLWRVLFLCFLKHFSNRNIFMWKYQAWSFTKISKERAGDWTAGIPTWVEVSSKSGFFGWDLSNCDNCGWIEKQRQHSRYSGGFCLRNIIMLVEAGMELLSCDLSCLSSYPRSGQPEYLKEASI